MNIKVRLVWVAKESGANLFSCSYELAFVWSWLNCLGKTGVVSSIYSSKVGPGIVSEVADNER
jgi:ferredoxin-fold anticodon binding domain-containing protein